MDLASYRGGLDAPGWLAQPLSMVVEALDVVLLDHGSARSGAAGRSVVQNPRGGIEKLAGWSRGNTEATLLVWRD